MIEQSTNTLEIRIDTDPIIASSLVRGALSRIEGIFFVEEQTHSSGRVRLSYRQPIDPSDPQGAFSTIPSDIQLQLSQVALNHIHVQIGYNGAPRDAEVVRQLHSGIYDTYLAYQAAQASQEPFL